MISNEIISQFKAALGENSVVNDETDLSRHSHDASSHPSQMPGLVLYPVNTQQVAKCLKIASDNRLPVTPCGKLTSLEGNSVPQAGGIVLDLSSMKKIIKVYPDDFQVIVEPGIVGEALNQELAKYHLYFPAFPASSHIASIGGMIANNAGGMYAVKYGVVGDWVMALEVVLACGEIIKVGSRSIKSVAGFDLKSLLVGSEGTLGIITQATLKLIPVITQKFLIKVCFPLVKQSVAATLSILLSNLEPGAIEFLDASSIKHINHYKSLRWNEEATLLIELHGEEKEMKARAERIRKLCQKENYTSFLLAQTQEEMKKIWEGRKAVHPAVMASAPNLALVPGDVGVPISRIPDFMEWVEKVQKESGLTMATFGHVGDGNFHVWITYDRTIPDGLQKAKVAAGKIVEQALWLGGTCTAEHGVGIGKRDFLLQEHGDTIELMKKIKNVFDPLGILNPGKIFA
ncbi:FAD-binding oxidoreductase [Candidatus Microgenomates bacterium]|nr:FAD-binding oxidoreductase [Candidatus Microgenomates bacterium]